MLELNIIRLNLCTSLSYIRDDALKPFEYTPEAGELLFCFAISPAQGHSIEPEADHYLDALIFQGRLERQQELKGEGIAADTIELPAGKYLFAQTREALGQEAFIQMAMEVQKEGLWERLKPKNQLYLRYLFEDGKAVTQVLRPFSAKDPC
ncbi:MAG: hypothetical protein LBU17_02425 [Treponema sp.]|jgi:hypothetical protein|nr:hypothetical protein [Treponema sp.]